ncbi:hypothetical protein EDD16DRAFT_1709790 [Pisolithus croceorrhizus]|nr:hypothetical protein EDD16DRAFT_1709790 [Pisolithus croceorrhizus]
MSTDATKIRKKIAKLNKHLDELESQLEPLFSQPLAETLVRLDTIQQAKIQVVIPYVVYDLVFVYLKSRGIDPMTHPVVRELDRVRVYFDKIKSAEESGQNRKPGLDKEAAERFIKHAIAQVTNAKSAENEREDESMDAVAPPTPGPSTSVLTRVPLKITSKMLERAEYERNLKELGDEEEDELQVFGETLAEDYPMGDTPDGLELESPMGTVPVEKGKTNMREEPNQADQVSTRRRNKRPRIDSSAGYEGISSTPEPSGSREISEAAPQKVLTVNQSQGGTSTSSIREEAQSSKSSKKKSRRKEKR